MCSLNGFAPYLYTDGCLIFLLQTSHQFPEMSLSQTSQQKQPLCPGNHQRTMEASLSLHMSWRNEMPAGRPGMLLQKWTHLHIKSKDWWRENSIYSESVQRMKLVLANLLNRKPSQLKILLVSHCQVMVTFQILVIFLNAK